MHDLLSCGILCTKSILIENDAISNPTKLAFLKGAYKAGININRFKKELLYIAKVPFFSKYKFIATMYNLKKLVRSKTLSNNIIVHAKEAPDKIVTTYKFQTDNKTPIKLDFWQEQISILSSYSLYVIALYHRIILKGKVE